MPFGIGCFAYLLKNYLKRLYFFAVKKTTVPSKAHIINSLIATLEKVRAKVISVALPSVKNTVKIATATPFNIVGGIAAKIGIARVFSLPMRFIRTAERSVANVPRTISTIPKGLDMFESRQPTVSPGMAAGVNAARMFNASDSLN